MCRIFGFRSILSSRVHSSLVSADNALMIQSEAHPDGWGVAYYHAGAPHIIKSVSTAVSDQLFKRVSGLVASETVVAHLRRATLGSKSILNTHPFQHGSWVFAHNGNIKNFAQHRERLLLLVNAKLRRFILGDTDSELIFHLILSEISKKAPLEHRDISYSILQGAIAKSVEKICQVVGPFNPDDGAPATETFLTFILSNGRSLITHQGGKDLYYSTYKNKCPESASCPSFNNTCENSVEEGNINHLLFSSEPLGNENVWLKMKPGQVVGVDDNMNVQM